MIGRQQQLPCRDAQLPLEHSNSGVESAAARLTMLKDERAQRRARQDTVALVVSSGSCDRLAPHWTGVPHSGPRNQSQVSESGALDGIKDHILYDTTVLTPPGCIICCRIELPSTACFLGL